MFTMKILRSIMIVLLVHIAIAGMGYVAGSNHFNDDALKSNYDSSQADVYNYLQDELSSAESYDGIGVAPAIYKFELIDLGTLPGGNASSAISINNNGQVVGSSQKQDSDFYYATLFDTSGNGNNISTQDFMGHK